MLIAVLAILFGASLAQRPANSSTCDYYATTLYGSNNSTAQFQLIQSIVALAFGGGSNLSNVSSDITGILNPGTFQNITVDLLPWFNGSIPSTNLNNQAVGINWLDEGGIDPLNKFLSGKTANVVLTNTTNEYRLFSHFFNAFAHIFGCSLPPPPPPSTGGPLSLAYIHKYMGLNFTDLGHFIDQLTRATEHFGFSEQDGQTFNTQMNSLYNVRCAPPITLNAAQGPQLLSLCQDPSCPLAAPNPDCAAYVNLTANGVSGGGGSSSSAAPSPSTSSSAPSSTSSPSSTSTPTSTAATTSTSTPTAAAPASTALSSGSIAGIAIGGAAGLALLLGLVYFCARRQRLRHPDEAITHYVPETTTYAPSTVTAGGKDPHMSYASNNGTVVAEMESSASPVMGHSASSQHHSLSSPAPVELGGTSYYDGPSHLAHQQYQPQQTEWDRISPHTIGVASPERGYA